MLDFEIPGRGVYRLKHLVLDVNGTLAVDGHTIAGVAERLAMLKEDMDIHLLTADTHGRQAMIDRQLNTQATIIAPQAGSWQKARFVRRIGPQAVCAIGNGANDRLMIHLARLGIAVLGPEGLATETLQAADVVVPNINAGLDLLLNPRRLVATLRT